VNVETVRDESWIASGRLFQYMDQRQQTILHQNEGYVHSTWSFPLTADLTPGRGSTIG